MCDTILQFSFYSIFVSIYDDACKCIRTMSCVYTKRTSISELISKQLAIWSECTHLCCYILLSFRNVVVAHHQWQSAHSHGDGRPLEYMVRVGCESPEMVASGLNGEPFYVWQSNNYVCTRSQIKRIWIAEPCCTLLGIGHTHFSSLFYLPGKCVPRKQKQYNVFERAPAHHTRCQRIRRTTHQMILLCSVLDWFRFSFLFFHLIWCQLLLSVSTRLENVLNWVIWYSEQWPST